MVQYIVFGKEGCPYCKRAKEGLMSANKDFLYFDINLDQSKINENSEIKSLLNRGKIASGTVPKVFVRKDDVAANSAVDAATNYRFLGGSNELLFQLKK